MNAWVVSADAGDATPLLAVDRGNFPTLVDGFGAQAKRWCATNGFAGEAGRFLALPDADGSACALLAGCDRRDPVFCLASLPVRLPEGRYALDPRGLDLDIGDVALGWALGAYQFTRYKKPARAPAQLVVDAATAARVAPMVEAIGQVRDLVNTPTEHMGPVELGAAVRALAERHGAAYREWVGDELLAARFPTIHAVGRAGPKPPRLIELKWGTTGPKLALVGKGVCFDSGGLDIKPSAGMLLMKKDMGGAAHALALAGLVMGAGLKVRLQVLVPAVENAVAGNAFRPGDVLRSRKGLTVEIGNTDAEGRLILGDALALASEGKPELIIDFATLTGAARVALGPDLPALFTREDATAEALLAGGRDSDDPVWRLPLHEPYAEWLKSDIADTNNAHANSFAGSSVAALFLDKFVAEGIDWAHFDTFAWRPNAKPGRPKGGAALGLRASWAMLRRRFG